MNQAVLLISLAAIMWLMLQLAADCSLAANHTASHSYSCCNYSCCSPGYCSLAGNSSHIPDYCHNLGCCRSIAAAVGRIGNHFAVRFTAGCRLLQGFRLHLLHHA